MSKKVHVVPHSHWDREWYFTTSRSKIYLMKDLNDVLNTLEKDENFKFMLDAQASILDDYLKWMPQDEERIKKFVKEKRLIIGPWYTQTDQMVISAESIVRNMYYGMKRCEEFGGYMFQILLDKQEICRKFIKPLASKILCFGEESVMIWSNIQIICGKVMMEVKFS